MNIFVSDPNPLASAQALDDVRLRKMNMETAQLLCTALRIRHGMDDVPYKNSHVHHPLVHWLLRSNGNIRWLYLHGIGLYEENRFRSGKLHKSGQVTVSLAGHVADLEDEPQTPFINCARNKSLGMDFTSVNDVPMAYQQYLVNRWHNDKRPPKWTRRGPPEWAQEFA